MRQALTRFAGIAALTAAVACGGEESESPEREAAPEPAAEAPAEEAPAYDPALLPEGVTTSMVEAGEALFLGSGICYSCHTPEATGGPLAPDLTDDQWLNVDGEYASIVQLIKDGVPQPREHPGAMLPRAGMPLSDEEVEALAAYTYMLSRME